MIHRKTERFPIYDSMIFDIIISDSNEEIRKALEDENSDETFFACVSKRNLNINDRLHKYITVILCTEDEHLKIEFPILVHEAVHVKNILFDQIGIKSKSTNDEPEAYFVEWVFIELSKEFAIFEAKQKEKTNE